MRVAAPPSKKKALGADRLLRLSFVVVRNTLTQPSPLEGEGSDSATPSP
jgi:hypothetical protein